MPYGQIGTRIWQGEREPIRGTRVRGVRPIPPALAGGHGMSTGFLAQRRLSTPCVNRLLGDLTEEHTVLAFDLARPSRAQAKVWYCGVGE